MKKLLYCALTFLALTQNLEVQAAEKKPTKKTTGSAASALTERSVDIAKFFQSKRGIAQLKETLKSDPDFDVNQTAFGSSLFLHAMSARAEDVCQLLLNHKSNMNVNQEGDLLDINPETGEEIKQHMTPLVAAVYKKMPEIFKLLLEKGANPNTTFAGDITPLMLIIEKLGKSSNQKSFNEYYNFLELLLKYKTVDLNLQDNLGFTAFHRACEKNFNGNSDHAIQVMERLLDAGANPTIPTRKGKISPLMTSVKVSPDTARFLLKKFPELEEATDEQGDLALHHAFFSKEINLDLISQLLQRLPNHGNQLLLFIIENNHPESEKILSPKLIEILGINPRQEMRLNTDEYPVTVLQAILLGQGSKNIVREETIDYLTGEPTFITDHPEYGTALHIAAKNGKATAVSLLIAKGFDPNTKGTKKSVTPLMVAIENKLQKTVNCLLPQTNLQLTDKDGNTALAYAAQFYHPTISSSVLEFYQKNCPHYLQIENNQGKTAYDLLPNEVKKADQNARELIADERKEKQKLSEAEKRAQVVANVRRAQEEKAFEEFISKKLASETKDEASNPLTETTPDPKTKTKFRLTEALKKFQIFNDKFDPETIRMRKFFLAKQGYFSDPSKESAHDRKARAKFYQQLTTTMSDEEAQVIIVKDHAFPKAVIQAVLDEVADGRTEVTVKASYTDEYGTHEGYYEVFFVRMTDEIVQVYHSLFKQTGIKEPAKKIPAATGGPEATDTASASACAADDFISRDKFTVRKTEFTDKTLHTITDKNTGTVYTLEIPK